MEEKTTRPAFAQTHGPIGTSGPLCAEEDTACASQEASSIAASPSSSSQRLQPAAGHQDAATDVSPQSGRCLSSSPAPRVLARIEFDWGYTYYIRCDRHGFFHTYPVLDGPYHSLQEADKAIDRHLEERRHPKMYKKQNDVSRYDMLIRRGLYWPDGTSKRRSKSRRMERARDQFRRLVLALLDKYKEDHNLSGDLACELKDVLNFQPISEETSLYYHLNFVATSKADGDVEVFAEVKHLRQRGRLEIILCCFCMLDPTAKGQHCNGCTIMGNVDMKHPDSIVPLAAGHMDPHNQFGGLVRIESDSEDEDTYMKTREAELRRLYRGFEEPGAMERLIKKYSGTPGVEPSN